MTTELEKQFFDTFGIEPKKYCKRCCWCQIEETSFGDCNRCLKPENAHCNCVYPTLSHRILLELICILSTYEWGYHCCYIVRAHNFEKLKEIILKDCIIEYEHIKHQVRTLFEEVN